MPWPLFCWNAPKLFQTDIAKCPQGAKDYHGLETTGVESVLVWTTVTKYHRLRPYKQSLFLIVLEGEKSKMEPRQMRSQPQSDESLCPNSQSRSPAMLSHGGRGKGTLWISRLWQLCPRELIASQRSYLQIQSLWGVRVDIRICTGDTSIQGPAEGKVKSSALCSNQIHGALIETGQPQLLMTHCQLYPVLSRGWIRGTWFIYGSWVPR